MKREPILADRLLAGGIPHFNMIKRSWYQHGLDTLAVASKFVLDAQAAIYLAQMLVENPRVVADAQDFAIPPFKKMWVEIPWVPFWEACTHRKSDEDADSVVGYLFDGPVVRVGVTGNPNDALPAAIMPIEYVLHRPMTITHQFALCEMFKTSRLGLAAWCWGESINKLEGAKPGDAWDKTAIHALRDNHTIRIAPRRSETDPVEVSYAAIMDNSGGDLRNIIGLLLYLNRTHKVQTIRDEGVHRGFVGNKHRAFVAYSIISLKLDPLPQLRKLSAGEGIKRRLHDVRGHFAHDKLARAGCLHGEMHHDDFGEWWVETGVLQWHCSRCNGFRWWQPEHKRGKLEQGVVLQQYAVTK